MWPLVGREAQLGRIAQVRATRECCGVVLTASAGVGKSRLARDAVAAAEADGASVTWIRGTRSAATVPMGAFAGWLPTDVPVDDPLALMRHTVEAVRERAEGRDAVLAVDDAQLLDPLSAALVLHLTVTGTVFIVVTVRTGEDCPDAVRSLWKDEGALQIELEPLSEQPDRRARRGGAAGPAGGGRPALDLRQQPRQRPLRAGAAAGGADGRCAVQGGPLLAHAPPAGAEQVADGGRRGAHGRARAGRALGDRAACAG